MNRSQEEFDRVKQALARPALVLSLALAPLIVVPLIWDLNGPSLATIEVAAIAIWLFFVVEFVWLFLVAPSRSRMVRTHLFELALVALPMLRPFRALKVMQILRLGSGLVLVSRVMRAVAARRALQGYGLILGAVLAFGSALVYFAESGNEDGNIDSLGDALWWALTTCTTVGYGDQYPVTAQGRVVGLVLMVFGVGLLSIVTASVAAYFVEADEDSELEQLRVELASVHDKLDLLLAQTPVG